MHCATKHVKKIKNGNKANDHKFHSNSTETATIDGY